MTDPTSPASPMSTSAALSAEDEAVVAAFDTLMEAELARGRLEAEGIGARIVDGNTVSIAQHLSGALGGVKLVVAESDHAAARALLFAPSALADDDHALAPEPEAPLPTLDTPDGVAERALRAAVLGFVLLPPLLHLWSLALAARVRGQPLSERARRRLTIALVLDGVALAGTAAVAAVLLG